MHTTHSWRIGEHPHCGLGPLLKLGNMFHDLLCFLVPLHAAVEALQLVPEMHHLGGHIRDTILQHLELGLCILLKKGRGEDKVAGQLHWRMRHSVQCQVQCKCYLLMPPLMQPVCPSIQGCLQYLIQKLADWCTHIPHTCTHTIHMHTHTHNTHQSKLPLVCDLLKYHCF